MPDITDGSAHLDGLAQDAPDAPREHKSGVSAIRTKAGKALMEAFINAEEDQQDFADDGTFVLEEFNLGCGEVAKFIAEIEYTTYGSRPTKPLPSVEEPPRAPKSDLRSALVAMPAGRLSREHGHGRFEDPADRAHRRWASASSLSERHALGLLPVAFHA